MPLQNGETIARITSHLYEGIFSFDDWCLGLEGIREALKGAYFYQCTVDVPALRVVSSLVSAEIPLELTAEYEQQHFAQDPRIPHLLALPIGSVFLDQDAIAPMTMAHSAVYRDFLLPHGYRHSLAVPLHGDGAFRQIFGIMRTTQQKSFGAADREFIGRLVPHLTRAARLRARSGDLTRNATFCSPILQALPQGVMVLNADCRIEMANPVAKALMHPGGADFPQAPLINEGGYLRCAHAPSHTRLLQLVAQACGLPQQGRDPLVRVGLLQLPLTPSTPPVAPDPDAAQALEAAQARLSLTVMPFHPDPVLAVVHPPSPPCVLVLIGGPGKNTPQYSAHTMAEMLGLTPTEARLALLLARGGTVKEFGVAEGVSWHTARTHAKNLLRKTGCKRQVELIRLIQTLFFG
ncbi:MAG: helix-turn-helix transcriptional regulator [Burkholderiaceae bacterium]|nr:helix-turn-helix transcriptional regulator [Burkholderiaceae bacterium]